MSANFMGGPRVALARIRDHRKHKLQQKALAQGATGATTAAAGPSVRRNDAVENEAEASISKEQQLLLESVNDKSSKKRRKEEADDANHGRSIDTTANRRDFDEDGGGMRGSVDEVIAEDDQGKGEDGQQRPSRSTSPSLDEKRRLLLDHDDWLGAGEIEGILRKKRKRGESSRGKKEKKVTAATAPGQAHGPHLSNRRQVDHGERDVAGLISGEVRRPEDASEEQAHQAATSSRHDHQDAGKSAGTVQHKRASPTQIQEHSHASEPLLPMNGLPALSLHPEALYTNSIKGLFTSGALGKGAAGASSAEERSTTKSAAGIAYFGDEDASKRDTNAAKPTLEAPQSSGGKVAEAGTDGELGELETMLIRQREETRRRLLGGH